MEFISGFCLAGFAIVFVFIAFLSVIGAVVLGVLIGKYIGKGVLKVKDKISSKRG